MNYQNFIKTVYVICLFLTVFSSCKNNPNEIILVYPNKVNYEPFIIANHLGYFSQNNNTIKIKTVNSGIDAAEALSLRSADIAAMGDGPAVILMSQQKKISIISRYAKGDKIHRLIADTSITSPTLIINKKIGIQMGSSTYAAFAGWLESHGLSTNDVHIIPMSPKNMPEAMKTKQLDLIAGSEPWALNVEKLCKDGVYELANLQSTKTHFPHLIVATNSCMTNNKDHIKSIISAINKANNFIANYPDSAAKISSHYIGFTINDAKKCMSYLTWEQGWSNQDSLSIEYTSDFLFKSKKIKQKPNISLFTNTIDKNYK